MNHPKIFIVSSGRAGSTLLQSLLNASQQIYIPQESDFIARAYPFFAHKTDFSKSDYIILISMFCSTSQDDGWKMSEELLLDYLLKYKPQTFGEIFSRICEAFHRSKGTQDIMWGIKRPVLIASLDRIFSVYPDAKIIHICRDGRDVYLSYKAIHEKSNTKFGPKGILSNSLYWSNGLRYVEEFQKTKFKSKIHEVKYENILSNPEDTVKNVCNFAGIEYSPAMIESFSKVNANRPVASDNLMNSIHSKISKKIDSKNSGKYINEMSRLQIFIYELVAVPYLRKYGYTLQYAFLDSSIFAVFRYILFYLARKVNDFRYSRRDKECYLSVFKK